MNMKLTKRVPARTKTFEASACKLDFMAMSPRFREIRSKMRNKLDKCEWCGHVFADGEMMALAISNEGNKPLCQNCGKTLLASEEISNEPKRGHDGFQAS